MKKKPKNVPLSKKKPRIFLYYHLSFVFNFCTYFMNNKNLNKRYYLIKPYNFKNTFYEIIFSSFLILQKKNKIIIIFLIKTTTNWIFIILPKKKTNHSSFFGIDLCFRHIFFKIIQRKKIKLKTRKKVIRFQKCFENLSLSGQVLIVVRNYTLEEITKKRVIPSIVGITKENRMR